MEKQRISLVWDEMKGRSLEDFIIRHWYFSLNEINNYVSDVGQTLWEK